MMKLQTIFALAILILGRSAFPGDFKKNLDRNGVSCNEIVGFGEPEEKLLRDFNPSQIVPDKTRLLSTNDVEGGVLKVETSRHSYVVRIGGPNEGAEIEKFAAIFVQNTSNIHTPKVRVLTVNEAIPLLQEARRLFPDRFGAIELAHATVTVSKFMPGLENGGSFLQRVIGAKDLVYDLFFLSKKELSNQEAHYAGKVISTLFSKLSSESKRRIVDHIKEYAGSSPPQNKTIYQRLLNIILYNFIVGTEAERFDLTSLLLEELLTSKLTTQIADAWTLTLILGIGDFHPNNWLITDEGRIVIIDLALSDNRDNQHLYAIARRPHPLGSKSYETEMFEQFQRFYSSRITIELDSRLRELTSAELELWAREAQYMITRPLRTGILSRTREIIKYRDKKSVQPVFLFP